MQLTWMESSDGDSEEYEAVEQDSDGGEDEEIDVKKWHQKEHLDVVKSKSSENDKQKRKEFHAGCMPKLRK